ncbi:MAG TPA: carboxymuconolactone decarboxylase family protein [Candidatus Ozemobacteraceae bacterium]|nr:carboxymuconolactone decarboxylase family protein [Candidatus Ozemobacteraceae bacterium]
MNRFLVAVYACVAMLAMAAISEAKTMHHRLNEKQRAIIPIAAFTANGDLARLRTALVEGLDAGLTVNEIKELLVQLYAYAGFPRSLNGLDTFMAVMDDRKRRGVVDETGRDATPLPADRNSLEYGSENQAKLVGQAVKGPLYEFAPAIDRFLKAHLFGDIFQRDILSWQDRELATLAALASIEGVDPQLQAHISIGIHNGLTPDHLGEFILILREKTGPKVAERAGVVLNRALGSGTQRVARKNLAEDTDKTKNDTEDKMNQQSNYAENGGGFPRGQKNEAYARYFTGTSYLNMLSKERVVIGNVTFEPGCRNFWHIHHKGGQILLVTGGRGWYQEWGKPARGLSVGDVVNIPPETRHWHGAAMDSLFSHVAVEVPADGGSTEWLDPVSDEEYSRLP